MNNDRQKILTDYISYLYTTGRTYDTVGKYIKHVTDFLEMTKEVNRRGYLNYKRENADVMVRHSIMCSAICDLLSFLNTGDRSIGETIIAPEVIFYAPTSPEPLHGFEGYMDVLRMMRGAMPDVQWNAEESSY